ncbi:MAG: hypothetical protein IPO07_15880 [Haliscomenobacter sp.]|nr:hypothetical protein [Haliscomenobacter sp.]MBK9490080.1 hypothetical protein [Haliscomenobacter sp.]
MSANKPLQDRTSRDAQHFQQWLGMMAVKIAAMAFDLGFSHLAWQGQS